jgi:hypothetical protein
VKIKELISVGWRITGSESGRWIVLFCRNRAEVFDSYFEAQSAARQDCGAFCGNIRGHSIHEITPDVAPARRLSSSFRKMVAAE